MIRERFAGRSLAGERGYLRDFGCGHFGSKLVFGRRGLQFLQRQFELIQKPRGALGPWTIAVAVEFLDLQFQMGDQRLVVGLLSSGSRSLRACDDQGRFQRFDVVWSGFTTRIHTQIESQILADDSSKIEASATILHVPDETYEADSANRFHRACTPTARPRFQLRRPSAMAK